MVQGFVFGNSKQRGKNKMADLWKESFDHAIAVARKAGAVIRDALQNEVKIMTKSSSVDLVTKTDQKVENII
ncbi:hypothetical protein CRUP_007867, partial [Coryphaenoides rupestris]